MVKFTALVHKETGKVIQYEEWLKLLETDNIHMWKDKINNGTWQYKPQNILFSDDFEIIYDSEFELEELETLKNCINCTISDYEGCKDLSKEYELLQKVKAKSNMELRCK